MVARKVALSTLREATPLDDGAAAASASESANESADEASAALKTATTLAKLDTIGVYYPRRSPAEWKALSGVLMDTQKCCSDYLRERYDAYTRHAETLASSVETASILE